MRNVFTCDLLFLSLLDRKSVKEKALLGKNEWVTALESENKGNLFVVECNRSLLAV